MKHLGVSLSVLVLTALASAPAFADTYAYTYTGNPFSSFATYIQGASNPYTSTDFVSGSFTLSAPLAPNLPLSQIYAVDSFDFSDGAPPPADMSSEGIFLQVGTDSHGNIDDWAITVYEYNAYSALTGSISTDHYLSSAYGWITADSGAVDYGNVVGSNSKDPGAWMVTDNPPIAATPEPSSLLLLGSGTLGIAGILRRLSV